MRKWKTMSKKMYAIWNTFSSLIWSNMTDFQHSYFKVHQCTSTQWNFQKNAKNMMIYLWENTYIIYWHLVVTSCHGFVLKLAYFYQKSKTEVTLWNMWKSPISYIYMRGMCWANSNWARILKLDSICTYICM